MTNNLPPTINITFTEEDVKTALPFDSDTQCVVSTALRRMGYQDPSTNPSYVDIQGILYKPVDDGRDVLGPDFLYNSDDGAFSTPRRELVGTTITLKQKKQYGQNI